MLTPRVGEVLSGQLHARARSLASPVLLAMRAQLLQDVPLWTPDMLPQPPTAVNQTCRLGGLRLSRDGSSVTADARRRCDPRSCVKELHEMCLVPHEHISDTIVNLGHFPDCDWLVKAWRSHDDPETRGERQPDTFVDAGANIGACSLEMLLRTDARVVAFEPSPVNRFYLTRSLRMAAHRDPSISRRIVLIPFALGAHYQQSRLHLSGGGSKVMPSIAGGGITQKTTTNTAAIEIRSLDGTLAPDLRIRLLKLDVSGPCAACPRHAGLVSHSHPSPGARIRVRGSQGRSPPPA